MKEQLGEHPYTSDCYCHACFRHRHEEQELPQRMRDAAAVIDELGEMAGPWQVRPLPFAWTADEMRTYADSLDALLERVGVLGQGRTHP
jgi:hypothetical protein